MLRPVIRLSDGGAPAAAEGLGFAYGLYDYNGDGIADIMLGQPFGPPHDDVLPAFADLLDLRVPAGFVPSAPASGAEVGSETAPAPIAPLPTADIWGIPAAPASGAHDLTARFDGLFDFGADHFLL